MYPIENSSDLIKNEHMHLLLRGRWVGMGSNVFFLRLIRLNQGAPVLVRVASGLIADGLRIRSVGQCHIAGAIAHDRVSNDVHRHRLGASTSFIGLRSVVDIPRAKPMTDYFLLRLSIAILLA